MLTRYGVSDVEEAKRSIMEHFEEIKLIAAEWDIGIPKNFVLEEADIIEKKKE